MTPNQRAFLSMLAFSEGTLGKGDDGYNVDAGGKLFTSYADHPRILVHLSANLESTAAGRYQILARTFDAYKAMLGLPDFSPASQDAIALQIIKEKQALNDVESGHIDDAITKCCKVWASLPGAGYGQRENSFDDLEDAYLDAGGTLVSE